MEATADEGAEAKGNQALRSGRLVCVVTGAGRGIGKSLAAGLLDAGIDVVAVDNQVTELADTGNGGGGKDGRGALHILQQDLTAENAPDAIFAFAAERCGSVDVLINNAALNPASIRYDLWENPVRFWELSDAQWMSFFAVNTHAPFRLSRRFATDMIARGRGRIINISTSFGTMIRGANAPYGPSKAAVEALSSIMAADLAGTGVTVNVVVPGGMTNTPGVSDIGFDRAAMLQPEIMVRPILWLVSEAAMSVTGRRFVAAEWDAALAPELAAEKAGAPIGWPELGVSRHPPRIAPT